MGLFGKSEDGSHAGSLWSRLTKNRKHEQKSTTAESPTTNRTTDKKQKPSNPMKPPVIRITEDSHNDNFRLSLQSLRPKTHNSANSHPQNRASYFGTEQLDSRLRTSKLQCEQLKRKVATISLECSKLESQCRELREVKEQLLLFQTDITVLKRKEKGYSEIQQRIIHIEEENFAMVDQVEHLRAKLSELKTEIRPELIHNRLDQLESDGHKLTSITLQNRQDHDRFSLDVGNQLVETFVTQQTIYEEFRRLQHRLVSVESQNQIMSDLIHFHCHNSAIGGGNKTLMTNSTSSRGALSMQASLEAASSSFSPTFSDRDAEKTNTSPSNIDWQFTDQADSLFLCDTLNKSADENRESILSNKKNKDYYKIDFTANSESLATLNFTDLSAALSASIMSTEEAANSTTATAACDNHRLTKTTIDDSSPISDKCKCDRSEAGSTLIQQKDDGYYSTSHDGTMATDKIMITENVFTQRCMTVFQDDKERYLILTRHVQKSRGRSLRFLPLAKSNCAMVVKSSMDLETHMFNRCLRQRQRRQRESQTINDDDTVQVFSDTELYGTRFCIDSDIDDDESPVLFQTNKLKPLKPNFGYQSQKSIKSETKHVSNLPPLIENVSERERKIEIKSTKKCKIVPPCVRPKNPNDYLNQKSIATESPILDTRGPHLCANPVAESIQLLSLKPPKCTVSQKSIKPNPSESPKPTSNLGSPRKPTIQKGFEKLPPPIPPRPKKKCELSSRCYGLKTQVSLDYVNDPAIRMSPEGCQDQQHQQQSSSSQMVRKFRDYNTPVMWRNSFSPRHDDCYFEDDDDDDVKISRADHNDEYYDQEFISELENYQLPNSTVNMLVMRHFK